MDQKNPEPRGLALPEETVERLRPHAAVGVTHLAAFIGISRTAVLTALAGLPIYYSTRRKIEKYLAEVSK